MNTCTIHRSWSSYEVILSNNRFQVAFLKFIISNVPLFLLVASFCCTYLAITGKQLKLRCGTSNLREHSSCETSSPTEPFSLSVKDFAQALILWVKRYRYYMQYVHSQLPMAHDHVAFASANAAAQNSRLISHIVYYEQLQADQASTLLNLWGSITNTYISSEEENQLHTLLRTSSLSWLWTTLHSLLGWKKWVKRNKDDLSEVLLNYKDIQEVLVDDIRKNVCGDVTDMFVEKYYRVFTMDSTLLASIYNCAQRILHGDSKSVSAAAFMTINIDKGEDNALENDVLLEE